MAGAPRSRALAVAIVAAMIIAALGAGPAAADFTPGANGLGDPFFPLAGNGGYDVARYSLALDYRPGRNRLVARARIAATATQDLSRFDLDYRGPRITGLEVNGLAAGYERRGQELVITPATGLPSGTAIAIEVRYRGHPHSAKDPDGSLDGWTPTDDGAFVAGEPQGSPTWFPCNDYPTDKAVYRLRITVPRGYAAVGNGALESRRRHGRHVTWQYREREPQAAYLTTATIGRFELDRAKVAGVDSLVAVDPREARKSRPALRRIGRILRLHRSLYGPYPFGQTGAIVDRAPAVGYALETQTRPVFASAPDGATLAHELAHQWFGDSVSLSSWPQIWLNEGFATWAEWRYNEEVGGKTTARQYRVLLRVPASRQQIWLPAPAALPGPGDLFANSVYVRGAMALEALREQVGDEAFYATMRAWTSTHAYGNATIGEFIAIAEAQSGQQLDGLFQTWLLAPGKPAV